MQQPYDIILSLESDNSRLVKEEIVRKAAEENNELFFKGANLALNSLITFGVKKIPSHSGPDGQGLPWEAFEKLASQLQARELTGNDAKSAIELALTVATQSEWNNWYKRILQKDLKCGVSEKTINNVVEKQYPQFTVPVFSAQLAHDSTNHENKVKGKKLIEAKMDGVRCLTVVYPSGHVVQYSRNGKELLNFEHIKQQFSQHASKLDQPYVFDGEIMSASFQDLMKQVHRKENVNATDAILYLFDIVPLVDFEKGICELSQLARTTILTSWYNENSINDSMPNIQILEHEIVNLDTVTGKTRFKEINQLAINGGYEGIMIKDPTAPYECKRSVAWLKLKPFIEVSLKITAVEEGTGKNEGRLGAFVCNGIDDGKEIQVNVGSGFTDLQRVEFWENRDIIVGDIVEVRADAITKNQDGTYSLRFPRFLRFRGFINNEKL